MKTIIHDLDNLELDDNFFILNSDNLNNCRGCFNCWTTTPLNCIFNDKCKNTSKKILESDTLIIISKNTFGTYSSKVKKILERNISIAHPYFVIRNKEIHHKSRFKNKINFITIFYGDIADNEKELLKKLVNRNAINLNLNKPNIYFFDNEENVRRFLNEIIY
jgi:multimeric flavodoxin WrbA